MFNNEIINFNVRKENHDKVAADWERMLTEGRNRVDNVQKEFNEVTTEETRMIEECDKKRKKVDELAETLQSITNELTRLQKEEKGGREKIQGLIEEVIREEEGRKKGGEKRNEVNEKGKERVDDPLIADVRVADEQ